MCVVFFRVFFRVVLLEISKLFISMLDLSWGERGAVISPAFKRRLRSLSSILFLEGNDKRFKTKF